MLRLIAVFHDSGMGKAIMTASSLHTQPVEGINPYLVYSIGLLSPLSVLIIFILGNSGTRLARTAAVQSGPN